MFKDCLHDGELQARINKLIREMVHMNDVSDFICNVKVGRQNVKVPKQTSATISAFLKGKRYLQDTTAVFEPREMDSDCISLEETVLKIGPKCGVKLVVTNRSIKDFVLLRGRVLGSLHRVAAVFLVGTGSMKEKDSFVVEQEDKPVIESTDV